MNYFGYERISTKEERWLQSFRRQDAALDVYAKRNNIEFVFIAKDDVSGKSFSDRDGWKQIESLVHPGDTIVFKDISRFIRNVEEGYEKYMSLMEKGVELEFIDNYSISTRYIKQLYSIADNQNLLAKMSLEFIIKLMIVAELDRAEQERLIHIQRIKDGIAASSKKSGRPLGSLQSLTPELKEDIKKYLSDRSIKQKDLMSKHNISRNTLYKYIDIVRGEKQL